MPRRLSFVSLVLVLGLGACGEKDTKLKVTSIIGLRESTSPAIGDIDGGTYVVIRGNRFTADGPRNAKVYFGSRQGTVVRFANDRELVVQAPGGKTDEVVDVLILFEPGGQLKIPNAFKFVDKVDVGPTVDDLDISKDKKK